MLNKKDKKFITEAITEALTSEVELTRFNKDTGKQETKIMNVYIPDFLVDYFSSMEGALRGMQETVDHTKNRTIETKEGVAALGNIMLQFEAGIKQMFQFLEYTKQRKIEDNILKLQD